MQINRLLEIIYLLLRRKTVTAKELANKFGVSKRTIYRDIDTLSLAGIPIYTESGKGGGIGLLPDFVIDKSILNEQEQTEILSALQGLSTLRKEESDQVLKKLSAVFNRNMANWIEVDFSEWGRDTGNIFNDLKTAILEKQIVEFDYYNAYGEKSRRRIEPMQLWFKSRAWYLKGYCLSKQGLRIFKLTRIKNLIITDDWFNEHNLSADYTGTNDDEDRKRILTLKFKIAPEAAYRAYDDFDESEIVSKEPDGSLIIMVNWIEDNWVYKNILSFGEDIEILEPEHIREIIKEKSERILKKYL